MLILVGIASIFLAFIFRHWIRSAILGRKTVAETLSLLENQRGAEFSQSYSKIQEISKIFLIAVKSERRLEVWTRGAKASDYHFVKAYPFTGFSGKLGPKLIAGDGQIPEGLYELEGLNPNSSLHLSIKIGYPNETDRKFAQLDGRTKLGGDIFIHGKAYSIGCIPIGDKNIEELFYLVGKVKFENVQVLIMPVDFRKARNAGYVGNTTYEQALYSWLRREISERSELAR